MRNVTLDEPRILQNSWPLFAVQRQLPSQLPVKFIHPVANVVILSRAICPFVLRHPGLCRVQDKPRFVLRTHCSSFRFLTLLAAVSGRYSRG